jgi:hypothetical protein
MVAVVESDMAVSSTDVAVIKTAGAAGTTVGAVYRPVFEMAPHSDPVPPEPETLQVTLLSTAFWRVAVNCLVPPAATRESEGETVTTTAARMVIVALADLEVSAAEVALTVTVAGVGTLPGAV